MHGSAAEMLQTLRKAFEKGNVSHNRVIASGMVGSSIGLSNTPCVSPEDYFSKILGGNLGSAGTMDCHGIQIVILPGLQANNVDSLGFELMRGEELQIAGSLEMLAANESTHISLHQSSHLMALPGSHCKWVRFRTRQTDPSFARSPIVSWRTSMAGEVFEALQQGTVLRHTTSSHGCPGFNKADSQRGFEAAVRETALKVRAGQTTNFLSRLFQCRSAAVADRGLDDDKPPSPSFLGGYLSGLVVGQDVVDGCLDSTCTTPIAFVGEPALCERYA